MKKKMMALALMALMLAITANAQVYAGDSWGQLPTRDLYDPQIISISLQHAQMAAQMRERRHALWEKYSDQAYDAFDNKKWNDVIDNVNAALNTGYYNSDMYYMRGYAYEQFGCYRNAKWDYKKAKKYGNDYAESALKSLKGCSIN